MGCEHPLLQQSGLASALTSSDRKLWEGLKVTGQRGGVWGEGVVLRHLETPI